jgi:hypothetical protein
LDAIKAYKMQVVIQIMQYSGLEYGLSNHIFVRLVPIQGMVAQEYATIGQNRGRSFAIKDDL